MKIFQTDKSVKQAMTQNYKKSNSMSLEDRIKVENSSTKNV